jgi:hypothetical protein
MHLDKKTITVLIACTLLAGIVGGIIGSFVGGERRNGYTYRTGWGMMGRNNGYYGRQGMMNQWGYEQGGQQYNQTKPPVSTTTVQ